VLIQAPQVYLNSVGQQADAIRLATPQNIDNQLSAGQASAAKTIFELHGIPGEFINAGDTPRDVIRGVVGMFLFSQRMETKFGRGFKQKAQQYGINFNTQYVEFPQALKNEFIAVRDDHGWSNLGLTNQSTLRQILKAVSQQFEQTPIFISGFEI